MAATEPQRTRRRRLDGLKLIAAYVHMDERQVRRLAAPTVPEDRRLPTFRLSPTDAPNAKVYAYEEDLDDWELRRARHQGAARSFK